MFFVLHALLTRFVHGGGGAGRALLGEREKRGRLLTRAFDVLSVGRFLLSRVTVGACLCQWGVP